MFNLPLLVMDSWRDRWIGLNLFQYEEEIVIVFYIFSRLYMLYFAAKHGLGTILGTMGLFLAAKNDLGENILAC